MSTVLLDLEGVLADRDDFSVSMQPSTAGTALYACLATRYRIVLTTGAVDELKYEHWLRSNGLTEHIQVLSAVDGPPEAHVRALRASRTAVAMLVSANPSLVAYGAAHGVPGLLWVPSRPAAGRLDLAPRPIRAWSAITEELDTQREMRETLET